MKLALVTAEKAVTTQSIENYFKDLGFFTYMRSDNELFLSVPVVDTTEGFVIDSEEVSLNGDPLLMISQYLVWIADKNYWIKKKRLAVFDHSNNKLNFPMKSTLLALGFTSVDVYNENSNFVTVEAKYCYKTPGESHIKFGGLLTVTLGDKFKTLNYITSWINDNIYFVPSKSKH